MFRDGKPKARYKITKYKSKKKKYKNEIIYFNGK